MYSGLSRLFTADLTHLTWSQVIIAGHEKIDHIDSVARRGISDGFTAENGSLMAAACQVRVLQGPMSLTLNVVYMD